jgi:hypothetical protein
VKRIDRDNILQASLWGMRAAYRACAFRRLGADRRQHRAEAVSLQGAGVVGGDGLSLSVARRRSSPR